MPVQTGGKWIFVSDSQTPPVDDPAPAPATPPVADPPKADDPAPAPATPPVADPPKADNPPPATPPASDPPKAVVATPPATPPAFSLNSVIGMSDHAAVEAVLSNWDTVKAYIES